MTSLYMAMILFCFVVLYVVVIHDTGPFTAVAIFGVVNSLMAVGTLLQLDSSIRADQVHAAVVVWTAVAFTLGAIAQSRRLGRRANHRAPSVVIIHAGRGTLTLFGISTIVAIAYFAIAGSAFMMSVQATLWGQPLTAAEVATQRLSAYSGDRYLFPGYVNQVKNVLLPGLFLVISADWIRRRRGLGVAIIGLVVVLVLLGTGQRGPFVIAAITGVTFLYWLRGGRLERPARLAIILGVVGFLIATIMTGRVAISDEIVSSARAGFEGMLDRVLLQQQEASVAAFRYIYERPTSWGREWLQGLLGLLPGVKGSGLANEVFATMYGSDRGTAPPSLWGSIYHNFGSIGVAIAPFLLATALSRITNRALGREERNTVELAGICGVFVVMGFWAGGGGIDQLLNYGIAIWALMWWYGSRLHGRSRTFEADV